MSLSKTALSDAIKQAFFGHKDRIKQMSNPNEADIDQSTEQLADDIADAIVDQVGDQAYIESGIEVEDSGGNKIGETRQSATGQIS